jgi:hypothetical protein
MHTPTFRAEDLIVRFLSYLGGIEKSEFSRFLVASVNLLFKPKSLMIGDYFWFYINLKFLLYSMQERLCIDPSGCKVLGAVLST